MHIQIQRVKEQHVEQGVAQMGHKRTGLPCNVGCPTTHAPSLAPPTRPVARPPAVLQTTKDDSEQNNTGQ